MCVLLSVALDLANRSGSTWFTVKLLLDQEKVFNYLGEIDNNSLKYKFFALNINLAIELQG